MSFVKTPALTIHYRQAGKGEQVVIFVHGNYASSRWWIPELRRIPECVTGYAPDLRGCGGREEKTECYQPNGRLTIRDLANDLREFVEALGLEQPVLVGHSLGGMIATEYALMYPDEVRGLVLVDTAPPEGLPMAMFASSYAYPLRSGSPRLMRIALRQVGLPRTGAFASEMVQDAVTTDPRQYVAFSEAVAYWRVSAQLPTLQVPVLLVWGNKDKLMPMSIAQRYLTLLPKADLIIIRNTGHSPHVERPDRFASVISAYLSRLVPEKRWPVRRRALVLRRRWWQRVRGIMQKEKSEAG